VGLSQRFSKEKEQYQIQGPMGKGLGLTTESKGQHLAFAAGTGVLPFVDMVARLWMGEKKLIPNDEMLNKDFELVLYASF
jgi:NAD(P)H-flavin reductase